MLKPLRIAACLAALAAASASYAQTYPDGTVRVVVPYPAGGPTDVMARLVAQKQISESRHQDWREARLDEPAPICEQRIKRETFNLNG